MARFHINVTSVYPACSVTLGYDSQSGEEKEPLPDGIIAEMRLLDAYTVTRERGMGKRRELGCGECAKLPHWRKHACVILRVWSSRTGILHRQYGPCGRLRWLLSGDRGRNRDDRGQSQSEEGSE